MKFQLSLLLLLSLTLISSCSEAQTENKEEKNQPVQVNSSEPIVVSPKEFKAKMNLPGVKIIDVRTDAEVADGMIPDASQINVLDWDNFVAATAKLNKEKPVLVYCKMGGRSNKAAHYLAYNGFKHVYDLKGGYTNWVTNGGDVNIQD